MTENVTKARKQNYKHGSFHARNQTSKMLDALYTEDTFKLKKISIEIFCEFTEFMAKTYGKCAKVIQTHVEKDVNYSHCLLFTYTSLCINLHIVH